MDAGVRHLAQHPNHEVAPFTPASPWRRGPGCGCGYNRTPLAGTGYLASACREPLGYRRPPLRWATAPRSGRHAKLRFANMLRRRTPGARQLRPDDRRVRIPQTLEDRQRLPPVLATGVGPSGEVVCRTQVLQRDALAVPVPQVP